MENSSTAKDSSLAFALVGKSIPVPRHHNRRRVLRQLFQTTDHPPSQPLVNYMKSIKQTLLLLALSAITTVASAQSWITNGLVGYYPFNGNAADLSGNGNNGTLYGEIGRAHV